MNFQIFYGITPQYLGTVECGKNCLSIEKIILLSQKTNISTDYILLGKTDFIDENMIKNTMNITEEQLNASLVIIKQIINLLKTN